MKPPTKKQQALLTAIEEYQALHKCVPSYRELMTTLGYRSPASIWRFIESLKKKGLLKSEKHQWRNIELHSITTSTASSIPIIGAVSKERAPELYPKAEEWPIANGMLNPERNYYALKIKDSSFLQEFLLPGDLIIVEATQEIKAGELVLASTQETIIGHFFDEGEIIRFRSNPYAQEHLQPPQLKVMADEVQVWGVIVLIFRALTN